MARIATADILNDLTAAVDAARAAAAADPRWLRAIDTAWGWLLQTDVLDYDAASHTLTVASASGNGSYAANGACQCRAYTHSTSQVCWHRAAARLVRRAVEAAAPVASSIEYDRESQDFVVMVGGQLVGFAPTHREAYELMNATLTRHAHKRAA